MAEVVEPPLAALLFAVGSDASLARAVSAPACAHSADARSVQQARNPKSRMRSSRTSGSVGGWGGTTSRAYPNGGSPLVRATSAARGVLRPDDPSGVSRPTAPHRRSGRRARKPAHSPHLSPHQWPDHPSVTLRYVQKRERPAHDEWSGLFLEREKGFEPTTSTLARWQSWAGTDDEHG